MVKKSGFDCFSSWCFDVILLHVITNVLPNKRYITPVIIVDVNCLKNKIKFFTESKNKKCASPVAIRFRP